MQTLHNTYTKKIHTNSKQDNCINNAGIGSLPEDSALTIEGTMTIVADSDEEFTKYFASTLSDIVVVATNSTDTATVTLSDCQYGEVKICPIFPVRPVLVVGRTPVEKSQKT